MYHKIRVNIKSLAAEARIIRAEKLKHLKNKAILSSLDYHKAHILKPEARLANLTYGYLKGYTRSRVENKFKKEVNVKKLVDKIRKFTGFIIPQEQVEAWLLT